MNQMASANTSAASIQKSNLSCCSTKHDPERRKSQDTTCSSNASCLLQKRKPVHPLAATVRFGQKSSTTNVKQRVVSAKLLKLRSVQSQLNDANFHLAELVKENRALRTLQKRQDKALNKYEGQDAELPRLMKSYEEQIRVLQEKNKAMKKCLREASEQLKLKDEELNALKSQLRHLVSLTKDKHLGEREKLTEELSEAKEMIKEQESKISALTRRLELEIKNAKYQLNNEIGKHKQCQRDLGRALAELRRLSSNNHCDSGDNRPLPTTVRQPKKILNQRQSMSSISLHSGSTPELTNDTDSTTDLKLEPIRKKSQDSLAEANGILKGPGDNIKARLSSDTKVTLESLKNFTIDDRPKSQKTIYTLAPKSISRTNSNTKLDILSENLQETLQKAEKNELIDDNLGECCIDLVKGVKKLNSSVDIQKYVFETSNVETAKLLDKLKETDVIDSKLRKNQIVDELKLPDNDVDIVNKIWFEEYNFQKDNKVAGAKDTSGNSQVSKDEKKKLLATLRAIDNGELVESIDEGFTKKNKIMKELFGNGAE